MSEEQLELRSAPHLRSIRALAAHIVGTRAIWFASVMGEHVDQLKPLIPWGLQPPAGGKDLLLSGLQESWQLMEEALARWTVADLEQVYEGDWRGEPYRATKQYALWHLIEHDLHHGGEIFLSLGIHGISTPGL